MSKLVINGGNRIEGTVKIHGAKNSSLPVLAATLLCGGLCRIHNCPQLSDVDAAVRILQHLGCETSRNGSDVSVQSKNADGFTIPDELMREMRSSIVFLGAIVARTGRAELSFPGGCELGPRPIDLHLKALSELGVQIEEQGGIIHCKAEKGLHGAHIQFSFPSVGATENVMLAAVTAKGKTVITNAAREPEICDLAEFLNECGAQISGHGCGTIIIEGVDKLHGCEHSVIADRIEAATYMAAAAVTHGEIQLENIVTEHLFPVLPVFEEAGCIIRTSSDKLQLKAPSVIKPVKHVRTMPYPGFPTDAQAIVMTMSSLANGTSVFVETIFDNRYKHVGELCRLGAKIKIEGRVAIVEGVQKLSGATVTATDLRGAAALAVAGMCAEGTTVLSEISHLDRGYEKFESNMNMLGADIKRI